MLSGLESILTPPIIGLKNKPDIEAGHMGKRGMQICILLFWLPEMVSVIKYFVVWQE